MRCSDLRNDSLERAHESKKSKYAPLREALRKYLNAGWKVEVLPWIAGVRGFVHREGIQTVMCFLEVQESAWLTLERITTKAVVESLASMHRLRFCSVNRSPEARFDMESGGALDQISGNRPAIQDPHRATGVSIGNIAEKRLLSRWKLLSQL